MTTTTQPRKNPAGGGHSRRVQARALEHIEAGWSFYKTAKLMASEGTPVAVSTIKRWADPSFHRAEIERAARRTRQHRAVNRKPAQCYTAEFKLERMRELRIAGLSYTAISVVAQIWWGGELTAAQVTNRLGQRHAPTPRPKRAAVALLLPPIDTPPRCAICKTRLRTEAADGLCGSCRSESPVLRRALEGRT